MAHPELTEALLHKIAHRCASAWQKRTRKLNSIEWDELYNDAAEICLVRVRRYDPSKGTLEAYLTRCCIKKMGDRITRQVQIASARSNNDLVKLRMGCKIQFDEASVHTGRRHKEHTHAAAVHHQQQDAMVDAVWVQRVRERMEHIAGEEGKLPLQIALGLTDVKTQAKTDKRRAQHLHQEVRRIKRHFEKDLRLYNMLKEQRCPRPLQ